MSVVTVELLDDDKKQSLEEVLETAGICPRDLPLVFVAKSVRGPSGDTHHAPLDGGTLCGVIVEVVTSPRVAHNALRLKTVIVSFFETSDGVHKDIELAPAKFKECSVTGFRILRNVMISERRL